MQFRPNIGAVSRALVNLLAPGGVLRAGINLSNFLLVTGRTAEGDPVGVAPDMARALAETLGIGVRYVPYANPGLISDAATRDEWDVGLIGAEPQRAEVMSFTPAYVEIEATYLVPAGSPLTTIEEVDAEGVRIAVTDRSAYGLWLDRNIRKAELVRSGSLDETFHEFVDKKLDVLSGLRSRLILDQKQVPGSRLLDGRFMAVQQAIGTSKSKSAALDLLTQFVEAAKSSGFVAELIRKHGAEGLSVA